MDVNKLFEFIEDYDGHSTLLLNEQSSAAKEIVGLLGKTGLPLVMIDEVLDYCKHAIKFTSFLDIS